MSTNLFDEILHAPDRDPHPGAKPIVSVRSDDDPGFLREVERFARTRYSLERRGQSHGSWVELDPHRLHTDVPTGRKLRIARQRRWHLAQPILIAGAVSRDELKNRRKRLGAVMRLGDRLSAPGELRVWLRDVSDRLGADAGPPTAAEELADPERDLAKVQFTTNAGEIWIKTGKLSTHPDDASLRMRLGFGNEGADDASSHSEQHVRLGALAEGLLPESTWANDELKELLERLCGRPTRFSQHIAYWNHPQGGALFHHDSFDEPHEDRQLGVCFLQLVGRTAWLALSIEDLADRVTEFCESLVEGELDWLHESLFGVHWSLVDLEALVQERSRLVAELGLPGCGKLASLVNCGPEFSSFLADAGHALVLQAGDALLLPNHSLAATAMHSVFCASPRPTYGVSMAIRPAGPLKIDLAD